MSTIPQLKKERNQKKNIKIKQRFKGITKSKYIKIYLNIIATFITLYNQSQALFATELTECSKTVFTL